MITALYIKEYKTIYVHICLATFMHMDSPHIMNNIVLSINLLLLPFCTFIQILRYR